MSENQDKEGENFTVFLSFVEFVPLVVIWRQICPVFHNRVGREGPGERWAECRWAARAVGSGCVTVLYLL